MVDAAESRFAKPLSSSEDTETLIAAGSAM